MITEKREYRKSHFINIQYKILVYGPYNYIGLWQLTDS